MQMMEMIKVFEVVSVHQDLLLKKTHQMQMEKNHQFTVVGLRRSHSHISDIIADP
jgi:hypothetical protein